MRHLVAFLTFGSLTCLGQAADLGPFQQVTAERLRAHLEFIASDLMEGRDTPSRGLDISAAYIVSNLKQWGVRPGNGESYLQPLKLTSKKIDPSSKLMVRGQEFKWGQDWTAPVSEGKAAGGVVYVGYGLPNDEAKSDPYQGLDLKGNFALILPPTGGTGRRRFGQVFQVAAAAKAHGAIGILQVPLAGSQESWQRRADLNSRVGRLSPESADASTLPIVELSPDGLKSLLQNSRLGYDDLMKRAEDHAPGAGVALDDSLRVDLNLSVAFARSAIANNVIGIIPGTDKKLNAQYIAFGAHYDHLGMKTSGEGDLIYNGADDDGSGTVSLLELAHAFASGKHPKRSLIFVWHCGEEKGLWGSKYFVDHPTVPIENIVAQLNIDMIGRSKPVDDTDKRDAKLSGLHQIFVIGANRLSNELETVVNEANKRMYKLDYDKRFDIPNDPNDFYRRSDHFNYAQKGIPVCFWFDGEHRDYHQVSDEVDKIDFAKMEQIVRTISVTGWMLGNLDHRIKLNASPKPDAKR